MRDSSSVSEEKSSLSLDSNTLIQEYEGLESSVDSSDSDESLNVQQERRQIRQRFANNSNMQFDQTYQHKYICPSTYLRNIKNYQMNESPSTKEETYINIQNHHHKNWQPSSEVINEQPCEQDIEQHKNKPRNKSFNINSFLNSQPIIKTNKYSSRKNPLSNKMSMKKNGIKQVSRQPQIITLNQQLYEETPDFQPNMQWRYKEARLNFIDSFMPQSLKIKTNPYQMLKYIQNKRIYDGLKELQYILLLIKEVASKLKPQEFIKKINQWKILAQKLNTTSKIMQLKLKPQRILFTELIRAEAVEFYHYSYFNRVKLTDDHIRCLQEVGPYHFLEAVVIASKLKIIYTAYFPQITQCLTQNPINQKIIAILKLCQSKKRAINNNLSKLVAILEDQKNRELIINDLGKMLRGGWKKQKRKNTNNQNQKAMFNTEKEDQLYSRNFFEQNGSLQGRIDPQPIDNFASKSFISGQDEFHCQVDEHFKL